MRLARFFIDRPVFAAVISIAITLVGAIAAFRLPVSEYPQIAPPSVTITALYPGASSETIAETVDWYLANQEWVAQVTSGSYRDYYAKQYGGAQ